MKQPNIQNQLESTNKIIKDYKTLIAEAKKEVNEEYFELGEPGVWFFADPQDTNVQDKIEQYKIFLNKEIEEQILTVSKEVKEVAELNKLWNWIMELFYISQYIHKKMLEIIERIMERKTGIKYPVNSYWAYANYIYLSNVEYLEMLEILDLGYELYGFYMTLYENFKFFTIRCKKYNAYFKIKDILKECIEVVQAVDCMFEVAYDICCILEIDFMPVAEKFKVFDTDEMYLWDDPNKNILED